MPELPEVQTIVNELRKKIIDLKITDFWSDKERPVKQAGGIAKFKKEIKGKKISSITRRAKFIVIDIEGDKSLFIHQKISGHLMYGRWSRKSKIPSTKSQTNSPDSQSESWIRDSVKQNRDKFQIPNSKQEWISIIPGPLKDERENQYIRYIWTLSNGYQLAMSDLRRFSRVILVKDKDVSKLKEIRDLGPEPLEITFQQFKALFRNSTPKQVKRKRGKLKPVLMDPFFIVGIGNIYSDEILWDAGYHPMSRVENLKEPDLKKIYLSMVKILKKAIAANGSSVDDYRLPSGEKGHYQDMEKAYQQTGKNCTRKDGGIIQRLKVGGRSAHFCSVHQKLIN